MAATPHRILLTSDTVGGVWHYAIELMRALDALGIATALATMGPLPTPQQRKQVAAIASATLHESAFRLEWMEDAWFDLANAAAWLLDLERELRPDVVHLNQFAFGALPFAAPRLVVAHACVLSWWWALHGEPAPSSWNRYRECVVKGLNNADVVAAPTRAMLQSLRRHYAFERTALVLSNACSHEQCAPAAKEHRILAAGLWDAATNLEALERVAPRMPWPIEVAGCSTLPDGGTPAATHVNMLGELAPQALTQRLAGAAIYALPARYEPFGLSIMEAGLSGCALVLGDIPSLREVWGDAAFFVAPDDDAELERALQRLIAEPRLRDHLAWRARHRALTYSPARMGKAYADVYARMLDHRAGATPAPRRVSKRDEARLPDARVLA